MANKLFDRSDYDIETYGDGFRIADYSEQVPTPYGVRFRGKSGVWNTMQPITDLDDVFETEAEAEAAITKMGPEITQKYNLTP